MQSSNQLPASHNKGPLTLDDAVSEFLFVSNIVTSGTFLVPREGLLSQYFLDMPADFAAKIIVGRDVEEKLFVGLDDELASIMLPLDFSLVVNSEYLAFSVKVMNSTFIVRVPVIPELCNGVISELVSTADLDDGDEAATDVPDFLASLENEAKQAKAIQHAQATSITVYTYYKPFGVDFSLKKGPANSRNVSISIADESLSVN
jgi:hypothetical protein